MNGKSHAKKSVVVAPTLQKDDTFLIVGGADAMGFYSGYIYEYNITTNQFMKWNTELEIARFAHFAFGFYHIECH